MATTLTDVHGRPPDSPLAPGTHVILSLECGRPRAGSLRIRLDGSSEMRIGRGDRRQVEVDSSGVTLSVPDPRMSALHACLKAEGARWRLEDPSSKNGTYLNGSRVSTALLADGDLLRLGHTLFLFRRDWPTGAESPNVLEVASDASPLSTLVPPLARRFDELGLVARTDIPVLLRGETGTGKEVMAKAIHALSRRSGELVAVNCGAIPGALVESELFGHRRGAFSGAVADQVGLFRSADGGTILLDEVGDLPLPAQVALLRVLQEQEIVPVGGTRPTKVNVRVVAATNRDLDSHVCAGSFREDLLARLAGFTMNLPPLRERREDVGLLVGAVLRKVAPAETPVHFTPEAGEAVLAYFWPRNIRELEKTLARALVLSKTGTIDSAHLGLPEGGREAREPTNPGAAAKELPDEVRRQKLLDALKARQGNLVAVARELGTSRSQVHRWLKRFRLDPDDFRS